MAQLGHSDAVDKRTIGEQLANWFYNGQRLEEETLREHLLPAIDPGGVGEFRAPQGASFSSLI